jgi:tripartite-type tricarboxylate transporter receptor subunit TctC
MQVIKRRALIQAAAAGVIAPATFLTRAQSGWPDRPIRFIVPFAPGGSDIVARAFVPHLSKRLGQQVIVENKPGGGTLIGTDAVSRAQPDGYTFLFTSPNLTINASLLKKLPYDTASFIPIASMSYHPFVLAVHASLPADNLAQLVQLAKKEPGRWSYASAGNGSTQHLAMEIFKREAGIDLTHIPYKGSGLAMNDLLGGQVHMLFNGVPPALPHLQAGKLKALGVEGRTRIGALKDVPTFLEQGFSSFGDPLTWTGLFAPAGTPAEITARMSREIEAVAKTSEMMELFAQRGLGVAGQGQAQFTAIVKADLQRWAQVIKTANIQQE